MQTCLREFTLKTRNSWEYDSVMRLVTVNEMYLRVYTANSYMQETCVFFISCVTMSAYASVQYLNSMHSEAAAKSARCSECVQLAALSLAHIGWLAMNLNNSSCVTGCSGGGEMFPFPPLTELIPISLFYASTFIIGLIGNVIVLFVVCTTHGESLLDNCLLSLTVADLCVILFCVPMLVSLPGFLAS